MFCCCHKVCPTFDLYENKPTTSIISEEEEVVVAADAAVAPAAVADATANKYHNLTISMFNVIFAYFIINLAFVYSVVGGD